MKNFFRRIQRLIEQVLRYRIPDTPRPERPEPEPDVPETPEPPAPVAGDIPTPTVWHNQDISGWPVTANLSVRIDQRDIHMVYDKAATWPAGRTPARDGGEMVGNAWVFVNLDGTWHAETWEWMRKGQQAKWRTSLTGPGHLNSRALRDWEPQSGEEIGIMVSTFVRGAERTVNERSNVVMVRWP